MACALQRQLAAQHFHHVAADANVVHAVAGAAGANVELARAARLSTWLDGDALIGRYDAVAHHPRGGTSGGRAGCRVFAAVEQHACADGVAFGSNEVKEPPATLLQIRTRPR